MLPSHRKTPDNLIMPDDVDISSQSSSVQPCVSAYDSTNAPQSHLFRPNVEVQAHYDLVIIGAGPAALAVISRILETRPAALYTEDEHRHLHFTHRQRPPILIPSKINKLRNSEAQARPGRQKRHRAFLGVANDDLCPCDGRIKILVIDRLGEGFMGLWRRNFQALGISHLRSPMFFHPDASDFDSLIAYANQHGKAGEGTPDQVVDLIERRIAANKNVSASRGRGGRRRSRGKLSPSLEHKEGQSTKKRRGSDDTTLPDLIEILWRGGEGKVETQAQTATAPNKRPHKCYSGHVEQSSRQRTRSSRLLYA